MTLLPLTDAAGSLRHNALQKPLLRVYFISTIQLYAPGRTDSTVHRQQLCLREAAVQDAAASTALAMLSIVWPVPVVRCKCMSGVGTQTWHVYKEPHEWLTQ